MPDDDLSASFLTKKFETYAYRSQSKKISLETALLEENSSINQDFDKTGVQDSWSYRNVEVARNLSFFLIDEKGALDLSLLQRAITILKSSAFSLGYNREHDDSRQYHLFSVLTALLEKPEWQTALKKIQKPEANVLAEMIIKEALALPHTSYITIAHARRAALSALCTKLRQNVGSCFATAPAIVVHEHDPLSFLSDIASLFSFGRLSRTYGGIQYTVPLSPNWGIGDLARPIFLHRLGKDPLKTLASSPGLLKAFASVSLIEGETEKEKKEACERLLKKTTLISETEVFTFLTPNDVIKKVLLSAQELKEEEVLAYVNRSIEGPLGELALNRPYEKKSKALNCSRYLKDLESAQSAFKSLTDHALLKSWEFTVASFAEAKADFAKWNLYLSLGVSQEDAYGIGRTVYEEIQMKIRQINEMLEEWQSKYDHLFAQAKYLEGRMQRAQESEAGWVRAEYEIRRREINKILDERDEMYEKGRKFSSLYSYLISYYGEKIPEYFQEIYDATMHDVSATMYDDSPAGFRLLYKHGRTNPSLWSLVHSPAEYIQVLNSFFVATENDLSHRPEVKGIERDLSSLITSIMATIKRPEFLEASIYRLARAYKEPFIKDPLGHLDKIPRKPWSYVSGGTMPTLVSCYFGSESHPREVQRWIESEIELLAFMIDTIKEMPNALQKKYKANPDLPLLAFSPTHAFLLKPGFEWFQKGWESDLYTYTWIRDEWVNPSLRFLDEHVLSIPMMHQLIQNLLRIIPAGYLNLAERAISNFFHPLSSMDFRASTLLNLSYERFAKEGEFLSLFAEEIDSLLFRSLPFVETYRVREHLESIFTEMNLNESLKAKVASQMDAVEDALGKRALIPSYELKNYAKGVLIQALKTTRSPFSFHKEITKAMHRLKLSYPEPILVGDTNWVKNLFGFTVNPGTGQVEFWRFDESGSEGRPISIWKKYLNGTDRQPWGIYTNPREYGIF